MLQHIDEYMLASTASKLLSFNELNALALVSKHCNQLSIRAKKNKVKEWEDQATKNEKVWIQDFVRTGKWNISPMHASVRSLRYRYLFPKRFLNYVKNDLRLTRLQKNTLQNTCFNWQDSSTSDRTLFEQYACDTLFRIPKTQKRLRVDTLRDSLQPKFARLSIFGASVHTSAGNIVVRRGGGVAGVIDADDRIWTTKRWTTAFYSKLREKSQLNPCSLLCNHSKRCPFCGIDVRYPHAHGLQCMKSYAGLLKVI